MILKIVSISLLVSFVSLSGPASNDGQDGWVRLLLDATVAAADLESNTQGDVPEVHEEDGDASEMDDVPRRKGGKARTKRQRAGDGEESHRSRLRNPAARAERNEYVRAYILAHPDERGNALIDGLRVHLGADISRSGLLSCVREARIELGQAVGPPRVSAALAPRRDQIIDEYVAANPRALNIHMVAPINAKLEFAEIPTVTPVTLPKYLALSRGRLNMPARLSPSVNVVERKAIITTYVGDHMDLSCNRMLEPIRELLRANNVPDRAELTLLRNIQEVKQELVAAASSTTTIAPESGRLDAISDAPQQHRWKKSDSEIAERQEKIRGYLLAHPGQRGHLLARGLNALFGTSHISKTWLPWVREVRKELYGPTIPRALRLPSGQARRRNQIIDEFVAANLEAPNVSMKAPINAILEAEGIPTGSSSTLETHIVHSRKRLNAPARSAVDKAAERRAVIENYVQDHSDLSDGEMVAALRPIIQADYIGKVADRYLKESIRLARAKLFGVVQRGPSADENGIRRRNEFIDTCMAANPRLSNDDLADTIMNWLEPEGLPLLRKSSLMKYISSSRARIGKPPREVAETASREAIMVGVLRDHAGLPEFLPSTAGADLDLDGMEAEDEAPPMRRWRRTSFKRSRSIDSSEDEDNEEEDGEKEVDVVSLENVAGVTGAQIVAQTDAPIGGLGDPHTGEITFLAPQFASV